MTDRSQPSRRSGEGGAASPVGRFRLPTVADLVAIADGLAGVERDEELVPALAALLAPHGIEDATVGIEVAGSRIVFPSELGDASLGDPGSPSRLLPIAGTPLRALFRRGEPLLVTAELLAARYPAMAVRRVHSGPLILVPITAGPGALDAESAPIPGDGGAAPERGVLILALAGTDPVVAPLDADATAALRLLGRLVTETLRRLAAIRGERLGRARRTLVARAVAELLPPADPTTLADRILELAATLTHADRAVLLDRRADELILAASRGFGPGEQEPGERFPLDGATAVAEAARTGGVVLAGTVEGHLARFPSMAERFREAGNRAIVALPLRTGLTVTGVLGLGFGASYDPSPADIEALTSFAGAAAAALDAARLRSAEAQIRRTLEGVVSQMPLGVAVADETGRLLLVNERVAAIWGDLIATTDARGYGEWIGFHESGERYAWDEWPIVRAIAGETVHGEEIEIERFDGARAHTRQWAAPIRDETGRVQGALAIIADISADAEVAKLRDAFIGVLSHELRTPVTTIYGAAQLLARSSLTPSMRAELVADISGESDRLLRMVQNLLVVARIERGVPVAGEEPVSVERVVRRTVELERRLRPAVAFEVEVEPGLPIVRGDEGYLEQVLRNLVSNGAKYGRGHVSVRVRRAADAAAIEVADRGPGFAAETRERVFDLFWRGPNAGLNPGSGIGLFVCRRLVEAMGGTIAAGDRADGEGGLVTVVLPALPAGEEDRELEEVGAEAAAASGTALEPPAST